MSTQGLVLPQSSLVLPEAAELEFATPASWFNAAMLCIPKAPRPPDKKRRQCYCSSLQKSLYKNMKKLGRVEKETAWLRHEPLSNYDFYWR